jgi:hypothetical protein
MKHPNSNKKISGGSKNSNKPDFEHKYTKEENNFINNTFPNICKNYKYQPAILPVVDVIIVIGDIHGDYKLAINLLKTAELIKIENGFIKWIADITYAGKIVYVVQVGDQVDRCRPVNGMSCDNMNTTYDDEASDIKILKLFTNLDKQARQHGSAVISLLGNHELMNSMGQLNYVSHMGLKEFESYKDPSNPHLTFTSGEEARKYAFLPGNEYGKFLGCTRVPALIIGTNLFVHAGFVDGLLNEVQINDISDLEAINVKIRKWLLGIANVNTVEKIINGSKYSMFWTRILGNIPPNVSLNDERCSNEISKVLKLLKFGKIFVGHTPQSFNYASGINSTCSDHIWRTDNASSKAFQKYDTIFESTGKINENRQPQLLRITNDTEFEVLIYDGK